MKNKKNKHHVKKEDAEGLSLAGSLLIGIGLGFYFDQIVPGVLLGLGIGFILMTLIKLKNK